MFDKICKCIKDTWIYCTFGLMLFLPRTISISKYIFVGISLISASMFLIFKFKNIKIDKKILFWFVISLIVNLIWILIGIFYGNSLDGLNDEFRLNFIWAIIYFVFVLSLSNSKLCLKLFDVMIYINFVIAIYTIMIYIDSKYNLGLTFLYGLDSQARIGLHDGYSQITSHNLGTMLFTTPFIMGIFFNRTDKIKLIINILISFIAIVVSGRRALLLSIILSIFLIFILNIIEVKLNFRKGKRYIFIFLISLIFFLMGIKILDQLKIIDINVMVTRINESLAIDNSNIRIIQIKALLEGYLNYPFFGSGFAKGVSSVVRSEESPWLYEVTYFSKLYNMGLIGFIFFIFILIFNFFIGIQVVKKFKANAYYMKGLLAGYLSFLIMCFTNPYLSSFDFMWILYIIPMYYNYIFIKENVNEK
ncbi:hypothetical protein C4D51_13540 [Clostridium perfringens]|nr:hypothetical protein [Clostridium perfringens]EJT6666001.1 hypothetical protein [Clostridium perfringens]